MKVIAINGSPKPNGSTATALRLMAKELEKYGIGTELVQVGDKPVQGCNGCGGCRPSGKCVHDDRVNETVEKLRAADGVILGSPTYYGGIAGGAKSFFDRLFFVGSSVKNKPGAAITVTRRSGGVTTYQELNNYLTLAGCVIAPVTYWNAIHGHDGEEIMRDLEGVGTIRGAAESMAWLLKMIEATKDSIPRPEMAKDEWTNFIR